MRYLAKAAGTIAALFAITASSVATAQVTQAWVARYTSAGQSSDEASRVAVDAAGNVVVAGFMDREGIPMSVILKYDPNGNLLWSYTRPGLVPVPNTPYVSGLAIDSDGSIVVSLSEDIPVVHVTIRLSPNGDELWSRVYEGSGCGVEAGPLVLDGSGNIYAALAAHFQCNGTQAPYQQTVVLKYDRTGDLVWSAEVKKPNAFVVPAAIALAPGGSIFVAGNSYNFRKGPQATWFVARISANGNKSLYRESDEGGATSFGGMALDSAGHPVISYQVQPDPTDGTTDIGVVRLDANGGNVEWRWKYDAGLDVAGPVALDGSNNVFLIGVSLDLPASFRPAAFVAKLSPVGALTWIRTNVGGGVGSELRDLRVDGSGAVYATGEMTPTDDSAADYLTVKYDSAGVAVWSATYNGPDIPIPQDTARALALGPSGDVVVTGYSTAVNQLEDILTIKYQQP